MNLNKFPPGLIGHVVHPGQPCSQEGIQPPDPGFLYALVTCVLSSGNVNRSHHQSYIYYLVRRKQFFWKPLWSTVQFLKNLHGYYFIRLLYPGIKGSIHYMGVSERISSKSSEKLQNQRLHLSLP